MAIQNEWARRGYFQAGFLGTDVSVASAMVATGKAAMLVNGTWQQKAIMDANPAAEIGFFALPMNATGEQIMIPTMAQGGIALNAKGGKLPQARRALSLYLGTDIQTAVIRDIKGISTNRNVKVGDPFLAEVIAALRAGRPTAFWHGTFLSEDVNAVLRSGYQALLAGATTVDRLAEEAQRQLAEELAGRF
jgi:raffinose/stachyose/melibiose transport system substrate-binding protein